MKVLKQCFLDSSTVMVLHLSLDRTDLSQITSAK